MAKKRRRLRKRRPYSKYKYKGPSNRNYKDPRYVAFRRAVRNRDKCCQFPGCRYKGKRLEVHHICKFSDYPDLRYLSPNGVVLCHSHHKFETGHKKVNEALFKMIVKKNERKNGGPHNSI